LAKITFETVFEVYKAIEAEGVQPTVRGVQARLGEGAVSTIHGHVKRIREELSVIPQETEDNFRPLLRVAAELFSSGLKENTKNLISEIDLLKNDLDFVTQSLSKEESRTKEALSIITDKESEIAKLSAEIKLMKEVYDTSKADLERARDDLTRQTIHEEDYQAAKAEAAVAKSEAIEARERAARLEGLLAGVEREQSQKSELLQSENKTTDQKKKQTTKKK
jgi:chromosome segregation ATPase